MAYYEGDISGGGFGGGEGWWIIVLFALIFGNGNFGGGGVNNGYVLTSDFATIERKLDGVNNGICSLGYEQLGQMNGINTNIFQSTYALKDAITQSTNQILASQQSLKDYWINEKMAEQQARINKLELAESQARQNADLINQLRPSPIPSYLVQNPNCCYQAGCTSIQ